MQSVIGETSPSLPRTEVFKGKPIIACGSNPSNPGKLREVVKTTILEQDPPNHKIVGGVCLHPPCLTSKDGVFIA